MVLPLIIGAVSVLDIGLELVSGRDLVELLTGFDWMGTSINSAADAFGIDHEDWTEPGGLLGVYIPTLPEVISGGSDSTMTEALSGISDQISGLASQLDMWGAVLLTAVGVVGLFTLFNFFLNRRISKRLGRRRSR